MLNYIELKLKIQNFFIKLNGHRTTDVYFIGYPKAGNTWLRFLIGKYVQLYCGYPELYLLDNYSFWGKAVSPCIGPSMISTHNPLSWVDQTEHNLSYKNVIAPYLKKKVVLIIRNPLDISLSFWNQRRYGKGATFDGSFESFLEDPVFSVQKCLKFYRIWKQNSGCVKEFHWLSYEMLKLDTKKELSSLLTFLDIPINEKFIDQAVEFSSFDNMKKLEKSGKAPRYQCSGFSVFATGDKSNPDAYHVRKGKVGGYKDVLPADKVRYYTSFLEKEWGDFKAATNRHR